MDAISFAQAQRAIRTTKTKTNVRVPVCARAQPPLHTSLSDGTLQSETYLVIPQAIIDAHSLRVTFANFYNDPGTGLGSYELPNPDDITVYATWRNAAGQSTAIIPGGAVLRPGEVRHYDLPLEVTAGDLIQVYTQVYVDALGMKWPRGVKINRTNEGHLLSPGFTDGTGALGTGNMTYAAENAYGPAVISGVPKNGPVPAVLGVGDSIMYGIGSGANSNEQNDKGFFPEALTAAGVCHLNIGMGSSTAAAFADPSKRRGRMACMQDLFFSHAVWGFATNDLGFSLSSQKSNALAGWALLAKRGIKVYALTCCPHTSDAGGTTPAANEANRTGWNDWIRDGAPIDATSGAAVAIGTSSNVLRAATHPGIGHSPLHPLWGGPDGTNVVWDLADKMETARNSGVWKSGYTDDGIHPSNTGHTQAKAVIDTTKFVV